MGRILFMKITNSKLYDKISNINHYYTYISELLTGIVYFLLIIFKPKVQTGVIIYSITVILGVILLLVKSKKDILLYILFSVIMYFTNFNFMFFNCIITMLLHITLLMGCIIAFLVNFRFNINYKLSVLFTCISIVLACLIIDFWSSKIHFIYLDKDFYKNAILAVLAADIAITGLIITINDSKVKTIFEKRAYGFSFNLIFEYAKRKTGLIIEDEILIKKNRCYKIQLVDEAYMMFMNCKMEITVGVCLLILNILSIVISNLNITIFMMLFTIWYSLWVSNCLKFLTLDEEKYKEYIINFVSFIYCTSYDIVLLNWMKDDFMSFVEKNSLSTKEKKKLVIILDEVKKDVIAHKKYKEQASNLGMEKLKIIEEIKMCIVGNLKPKIILPN